jgi:hypothetical protein
MKLKARPLLAIAGILVTGGLLVQLFSSDAASPEPPITRSTGPLAAPEGLDSSPAPITTEAFNSSSRAAQETASQAGPALEGGASGYFIHGLVLDEQGEPVTLAEILMYPLSETPQVFEFKDKSARETDSDLQGEFTIRLQSPGHLVVRAKTSTGEVSPHRYLEVSSSSPVHEITLVVSRPASIRGKVVELDNQPSERVEVVCLVQEVASEMDRPSRLSNPDLHGCLWAITDQDGHFEFNPALHDATYVIRATSVRRTRPQGDSSDQLSRSRAWELWSAEVRGVQEGDSEVWLVLEPPSTEASRLVLECQSDNGGRLPMKLHYRLWEITANGGFVNEHIKTVPMKSDGLITIPHLIPGARYSLSLAEASFQTRQHLPPFVAREGEMRLPVQVPGQFHAQINLVDPNDRLSEGACLSFMREGQGGSNSGLGAINISKFRPQLRFSLSPGPFTIVIEPRVKNSASATGDSSQHKLTWREATTTQVYMMPFHDEVFTITIP